MMPCGPPNALGASNSTKPLMNSTSVIKSRSGPSTRKNGVGGPLRT